ncbi:4Fe-4S binding protein [Micromonospora sp. B11E3]|uniref:4Fe-4S binding protein n=1 Tax=Micromonospora sp. B11E3 TaxID=3153562 RepID=UPI00325C5B79
MAQLTAPVVIGPCQGCGACLLTCPTHAIRPTPAGLRVRADRCTGCLECLEICPVDAIRVAGTDRPEGVR